MYRRYATKKLVEFRSEATTTQAADEIFRRLDLLDQLLVDHKASEKARLARKHQREAPKIDGRRKVAPTPAPAAPAPAATGLMNLWESMLPEGEQP